MPDPSTHTIEVTPKDSVVTTVTTVYVFEEEDVNIALAWENREDFFTVGKLKSVGGAVASAALGAVVPPLGGNLAALRLARTMTVMGALEALRTGGLSGQAKDDVEWIIKKKQSKAVKAGIATVPEPHISKLPLAWNIVRALKKKFIDRNQGDERFERAARIYAGIKKEDDQYCAIVFALFTNKDNPGLYLQRLLSTDDQMLAVHVLMGKIASR